MVDMQAGQSAGETHNLRALGAALTCCTLLGLAAGGPARARAFEPGAWTRLDALDQLSSIALHLAKKDVSTMRLVCKVGRLTDTMPQSCSLSHLHAVCRTGQRSWLCL